MTPIRHIVIVGGGTSGWLAAAMLSHQFKRDLCRIELVESPEIATIGIGESTVPPFVGLIRRLGIDETAFIQATQATYKLGIKFVGWHTRRAQYFHPFGVLGRRVDGNDFYHCWLRARTLGDTSSLQDYSPCSVMADQGRFFAPGKAPNTPIGGAGYGLHIDAGDTATFLRSYATARGVVRSEGHVTGVERRDGGFIDNIVLKDGRRIGGDFFLDCTGFKALLIGGELGVGFRDWSHYLPCDRAIAVKTDSAGPTHPYTLATARKAGWTWRIPLRHHVGQGYVFASRFCSDANARSDLLRTLDGKLVDEPRLIAFPTGHRHEIWKHNCLSLGLAAGFIEPLEAPSIHLIARGVDFFLRYFPDRECHPALVREYNRRMIADYEEVRDFILLHYCTSARRDTPFWRWCAEIPMPDSLRERIELFCSHGLLREGADELFRSTSWQSVFEGMGIRPEKYSPTIDNLDPDRIRDNLNTAREAISGMVRHLPSHDDYLDTLAGGS